MEIDKDQNSFLILKSLNILNNQIDLSNKNSLEKEVLKLLLVNLKSFYIKKVSMLDSENIEKLYSIQSYMTEAIADVNDAIKDEADVLSYAEKINGKLRDKNISNLINRNKVLNYKLR